METASKPARRRLVPTIPITDRRFRWTDSGATNIRKRFDAVRWHMARAGTLITREFVCTLEVDVVAKVPR